VVLAVKIKKSAPANFLTRTSYGVRFKKLNVTQIGSCHGIVIDRDYGRFQVAFLRKSLSWPGIFSAQNKNTGAISTEKTHMHSLFSFVFAHSFFQNLPIQEMKNLANCTLFSKIDPRMLTQIILSKGEVLCL